MFCVKCGEQLPEDARFCRKCGAVQASKEAARTFTAAGQNAAGQNVAEQFSGGVRLVEDSSLPEGIFRDEQGAYHWFYHMNMWKNPVPLLVMLKVIFSCCIGVSVAVGIMSYFLGANGLEYSVRLVFWLGFGLTLLCSLIACGVWVAGCIWRCSLYVYEYLMNEERVVVLQTPVEKEHSKKLATVAFALAALGGGTVDVAAGMTALAGERVDSVYTDVRKVAADRRHDLIKVNNLLMHNAVFAERHQYDFVWNYLTAHCTKAKIKG